MHRGSTCGFCSKEMRDHNLENHPYEEKILAEEP